MAKTNNRLGRGLSALLKDEPSVVSASDKGAEKLVGSILEVELKKIKTNPYQPRTNFDKNALEDLVKSIGVLGVIQPITVRKIEEGYELISGERRFRASQIVGLESIPAYVRLANDQEMLEMALVENIQRQDLDAIEIALSYQRLLDEINLTHEQLSHRVGKDRTSISNYLRLLKLDPIIQTGIRDGMISMGHGRAIIAIDDVDLQLEIYEKVISENLSVRDTEKLIKTFKNPVKAKPVKSSLPNEFKKVQKDFSEKFGSNVEIKRSQNGKGKIIIDFKSDAEFERLRNLFE
ncbi:ParB/RepB/Spo0J family partition protein [Moheibacter sediminis]|uniref:Chromosome partitioning protein, ParB family n=1 Tax=Moheibacter sediminis TaxID=1434700 RepID=A0A1W2AJ87_9FLAO|nr:ParB/RepB/Spo0J family partition protein [Moheibacter sediminis]SMC60765.1 chromosome partitioning protein, ParB family [Moheibacter sediminis]